MRGSQILLFLLAQENIFIDRPQQTVYVIISFILESNRLSYNELVRIAVNTDAKQLVYFGSLYTDELVFTKLVNRDGTHRVDYKNGIIQCRAWRKRNFFMQVLRYE